MKMFPTARVAAAAICLVVNALPASAQRNCGTPLLYQQMEAADPQAYQEFRRQSLVEIERAAMGTPAAARTTAQYAIPVVFHFVLTNAQYIQSGRDTGILRRVQSQITVLNQDFNGQNPDRSKIPAGFSSLFDNPGVQFGLANFTSSATIAPGVELRILSSATTFDVNNGCAAAKNNSTGLAPASTTTHLNIWVVNITNSGSGQILGVTVPPDFVGYPFGSYTITQNDVGIVLNYGAVGKREFANQSFISGIDGGRTLTHEAGHYFNLRHVWGDDNGACPGTGGSDDGIGDTPPQADASYCTLGTSKSDCPTYPYYDACSPSGNGIMFMNYMDYVNDAAMFMFSKAQGNVMRSRFQAGGISYGLTQNPQLLGVETAETPALLFEVGPNPTSDAVSVRWDLDQKLQTLTLTDFAGSTIQQTVVSKGQSAYQLDLSPLPRGLYFVRATFATGTVVRKVVLQ